MKNLKQQFISMYFGNCAVLLKVLALKAFATYLHTKDINVAMQEVQEHTEHIRVALEQYEQSNILALASNIRKTV